MWLYLLNSTKGRLVKAKEMIPQTTRALVLSGVMKCNQKGFNLITLRIDEPSLHTLNIDPNFYLNKKSSDKNHQST